MWMSKCLIFGNLNTRDHSAKLRQPTRQPQMRLSSVAFHGATCFRARPIKVAVLTIHNTMRSRPVLPQLPFLENPNSSLAMLS
jgi:hypothetical protein